jgi:hypothetical protein
MKRSEQINEIMGALAKAQGEIMAAPRDASNPHLETRYATLASLVAVCREPLSKNGLAVSQAFTETEGRLFLVTVLGHASGQWLESWLPVRTPTEPPKGLNVLQAGGSAISYARRYAYAAIVGVTVDEDDDDGAGTEKRTKSAAGRAPAAAVGEVWDGPEQCPRCHAPAGKRHGKPCISAAA